MKIAFNKPASKHTIAVYVAGPSRKSKDAIADAIKAADFKGKEKDILDLPGFNKDGIDRLIVIAAPSKKTELDWQNLGGDIVKYLRSKKIDQVDIVLDDDQDAAQIALGAALGSYRFDVYKTDAKKKKGQALPSLLTFHTNNHAQAKKELTRLEAIAQGVFLTRDLVWEPANTLTPVTFAKRCQDLAKKGLEVDVLDEKKMAKLGMGALLGVAQGSANKPRLVVMKWMNGKKSDKPLVFVGKGVTFDTGGISIKPSSGMEEMKWDMGGAGTVTGLMRALAGRKAKVNAVGIIGLVENMPSGTAQRPGDVVTSMSGKTIEVINTDAEGRLVLADALCYAQQNFDPELIIDLATLTGAIIVSLGNDHAGMFCNNDKMAGQLQKAGSAVDEQLWRMPLGEVFDKEIDSDIADIRNHHNGRHAGSCVAAAFLQRFIEGKTPWAHLDIAGVAWSKKDKPVVPKGGTGFGVRLLDRFVSDNFEN